MLTLRYFGERTQREIADELNISQMHVSRVLTRTLTRLRAHLVDGVELPTEWQVADQSGAHHEESTRSKSGTAAVAHRRAWQRAYLIETGAPIDRPRRRKGSTPDAPERSSQAVSSGK